LAVGIKVGSIITEVGAPTFLNAFFSTVTAVLEAGSRGSVYPVISNDFYKGNVSAEKVELALAELKAIRAALGKYPPRFIVWDLEDRTKQPPWGEKISPDITSLSNYFVTSGGRDLFEVFFEVFEFALHHKLPVVIEGIKFVTPSQRS